MLDVKTLEGEGGLSIGAPGAEEVHPGHASVSVFLVQQISCLFRLRKGECGRCDSLLCSVVLVTRYHSLFTDPRRRWKSAVVGDVSSFFLLS